MALADASGSFSLIRSLIKEQKESARIPPNEAAPLLQQPPVSSRLCLSASLSAFLAAPVSVLADVFDVPIEFSVNFVKDDKVPILIRLMLEKAGKKQSFHFFWWSFLLSLHT